MQTGASISYSNTTISTDVREKQGVVSTISTRLETPDTASPSPGKSHCCIESSHYVIGLPQTRPAQEEKGSTSCLKGIKPLLNTYISVVLQV